jgi:hypothetical protein
MVFVKLLPLQICLLNRKPTQKYSIKNRIFVVFSMDAELILKGEHTLSGMDCSGKYLDVRDGEKFAW